MTSKVPTAEELGIGTTRVTLDPQTPFQSFTVPRFDVAAAQLKVSGEQLQAGSKQLASAIASAQAKNQKRALLQFETQVDALNNELLLDPINGLANKTGQAALDSIVGRRIGVDDNDTVGGIGDTYQERLQQIRSNVGADLTQATQDTLALAGQQATNKFTAIVNKAQIQAQTKVDADLVAARVSRAAENAALAVGQSSAVLAGAIKLSLRQAETSVTDPPRKNLY
jgi:hypothetical protein